MLIAVDHLGPPLIRNSFEATVSESSLGGYGRRRLLRAMEARKMLLHKEQGMAFARATAAGFDMQKMEHLLVFADCFGANRLGYRSRILILTAV